MEAPKYTKSMKGESVESVPYGGCLQREASFVLRISLGDMPLEDAFCVIWSSEGLPGLPLWSLFDQLFPEEAASRTLVLESLDVHANPDLPDMYLALVELFQEWREDRSTLRFFVNNGPEIALNTPIAGHLDTQIGTESGDAAGPVLDIVIEQTYEVLTKFTEWGGDKDKLLGWLRGCTLLYFMDKHSHRLAVDSRERDWHVEFAVEDLRSRGLIARTRDEAAYQITRAGRRFIGHQIAETESYIKHFDVFKDVWYDSETEVIRFGTGRGEDLRVQVYNTEGLDAIRVVFLLRMYDRTLDQFKDSWSDDISLERFFNHILQPVLDHDRADNDLIDWVIESGFAHNEEQAELAREKEAQREIIKRVRSD